MSIKLDEEVFKWSRHVEQERRHGAARGVVATMAAMFHTMQDEGITLDILQQNHAPIVRGAYDTATASMTFEQLPHSDADREQHAYLKGQNQNLKALSAAFSQYMEDFCTKPPGDLDVAAKEAALRSAMEAAQKDVALPIRHALENMIDALDLLEGKPELAWQVKVKIVPEDARTESLLPVWYSAIDNIKPGAGR